MPKVQLSVIEQNYEAYGQGPTLVMIPGLYSSAATSALNLLKPFLEKDYKIIIGDNRGVGLSGRVDFDYSTGDMAEDTFELLEALGEAKVHVLGSSMGSMIAQHLAINHPDKVKSLILADSAPYATVYTKQTLYFWMFATSRMKYHEFSRLVNLTCFPPEYYEAHGDAIIEAEKAAEKLLADLPPFDHEVFCRLCRAITRHNTLDRLHEISAPTLVISGGRDLICPPQYARQMSQVIPDCRYVELETCGHGIVSQQTQTFAQHIKDFAGLYG